MDHIDKKMLLILWKNCRISFRKLGSILGLSGASTKKRVDRLLESGAIHDFYVVLGEAMVDMKRTLVLVRTTPTASVSDLSIAFTKHPGIFRILSLVNGDFLLIAMYPEKEGSQNLEAFIYSLDGVKNVNFFPIYRLENCTMKGRKCEISEIQRKVLSCLVVNARMPASEVAKQVGLPTRKIECAIEELQNNRNVIFSVRWKPNLGRGLAFMLRITYKNTEIEILPFNNAIAERFPSEFWYSYLPENSPDMFSVFLVDGISDVCRITEAAKRLNHVTSVETMIYYSATVKDPPTRTHLIELLQQGGVLTDYHPRVPLKKDIVV